MVRRRSTTLRRKRIWARETISEVLFTLGANQPLQFSLTSGYRDDLGVNMLPPGSTVGGLHVNYSFLFLSATANQPVSTELAVIWGIIAGGYSAPPTTFNNAPPSPLDQPHEDWMWYERTPFSPSPSANSTQVTSHNRGSGPLLVKSRRKLDELGDDIFVCAEVNPNNIGTPENAEITATFHISTLMLLP